MKMSIRWKLLVAGLALMLPPIYGQSNGENCDHVPSPPGRAVGIDDHCPVGPNSNGIAKADFNGDGFADLAIGTPTQTVGGFAKAGAVNVVYGSQPNGLTTNTSGIPHPQSWSGADTLGIGASEAFGTALAAGDFNGDGYSDLAISVPGLHRIVVLFGSANGLTSSGFQLFIPCGGGTIGGLSWGDYNGDAKGDLVVGCPDSASVQEFNGTTNGLNLSPTKLDLSSGFYPNAPSSPFGYGHIGTVVASGDFNGDGRTDLAIGVPDMKLVTTSTTDWTALCLLGLWVFDPYCLFTPDLSTNTAQTDGVGLVVTIYGSDQGLTTKGAQIWAQGVAGICCHPGQNAHFGAALAAGDFNGDGKQDLAMSLPGGSVGGVNGAGAVIVIYGSSGGLTPTGSQIWNENDVGSAQVNNGFGTALAAGDFNGDGKRDLVIGIPNEAINGLSGVGKVAVIYGSSSGLSTSGRAPQVLHQSTIQDNAFFGSSLSAWDFGQDVESVFPLSIHVTTDLAIGSPGFAVNSVLNAGAITVFYGSFAQNGLTSFTQLITQATLGFPVSADRFGGVVY
jgi:hypothetical protein